MNIEYLKYFAELAKLQHYGKAAKALNISQPGLSHAIKTLEDEYGVPLFQKEGRNVSLSRYGKELMQDVEEILDAYLRMEERAAGLRTEEKTVRIGTVYPLAAGTIPHMLREFGATFPFIIYNRLTPEIEEGLLDGKYDIGFCSELLKSEAVADIRSALSSPSSKIFLRFVINPICILFGFNLYFSSDTTLSILAISL